MNTAEREEQLLMDPQHRMLDCFVSVINLPPIRSLTLLLKLPHALKMHNYEV